MGVIEGDGVRLRRGVRVAESVTLAELDRDCGDSDTLAERERDREPNARVADCDGEPERDFVREIDNPRVGDRDGENARDMLAERDRVRDTVAERERERDTRVTVTDVEREREIDRDADCALPGAISSASRSSRHGRRGIVGESRCCAER